MQKRLFMEFFAFLLIRFARLLRSYFVSRPAKISVSPLIRKFFLKPTIHVWFERFNGVANYADDGKLINFNDFFCFVQR
jgi:hypothetical protein